MNRHISYQEAQSELERVVKQAKEIIAKFGLTEDKEKDFSKNNFLQDFRALHAQLKESDELKIEFGGHFEYPNLFGLNMVLYRDGKMQRIVRSYSSLGSSEGNPSLELLYPD